MTKLVGTIQNKTYAKGTREIVNCCGLKFESA